MRTIARLFLAIFLVGFIFVSLAAAFLLFFHVVLDSGSVFPKEHPSFAHTFINTGEYVDRWNNDVVARFQLSNDYVFLQLQKRGLVQTVVKNEQEEIEPELPDEPSRQSVLAAIKPVKMNVQRCLRIRKDTVLVRIAVDGSTGNITDAKAQHVDDATNACIARELGPVRLPTFRRASFTIEMPFKALDPPHDDKTRMNEYFDSFVR